MGKLKITQISAALENGMLFTLGLGDDNRVYLWNSEITDWVLHKSVSPPPAAAEAPVAPNRKARRNKK